MQFFRSLYIGLRSISVFYQSCLTEGREASVFCCVSINQKIFIFGPNIEPFVLSGCAEVDLKKPGDNAGLLYL